MHDHPLLLALGAGLDLAYGLALELVRLAHRFFGWSVTRRVGRIGWRALRVGTWVALLVLAARGAGWLGWARG